MLKRICVYCGSSPGARPAYAAAARSLGSLLAKRRIGLVYGGSDLGTMGALAQAVIEGGGETIGVIPRFMHERVSHPPLTEIRVVDDMHARKALMAELADGFIALPGGMGTLEEIVEIVTWAQLGMHRKPCGYLNIGRYYGKLLGFLDHAVTEGFVRPAQRAMILVDETPEGLLDQFDKYRAPAVDPWEQDL